MTKPQRARRRSGREGNEGGAAHGAKATSTRRTRRRGGAPVAETDDEHYWEHVRHFRRARVETAYGESVDLVATAWKENPEFGLESLTARNMVRMSQVL
jgi:hypothetical protein